MPKEGWDMYLYYCNHRECAGHIKSWERCDDWLAMPGRQLRSAQAHAARPASARQAEAHAPALAVEPSHGCDITWV